MGWLKRKNVKFIYMVFKGNFFIFIYGYVKVTLKEHYDNNKSPNQSYLFCLKVKKENKFIFIFFINTMEFELFREIVFKYFNRRFFFEMKIIKKNIYLFIFIFF